MSWKRKLAMAVTTFAVSALIKKLFSRKQEADGPAS